MKRALLWVPLLVFVGLLGIVVAGLVRPTDHVVRSALIGKPLPDFALPPLVPDRAGTTSVAFRGRPRLLNVFASWCVPCIAEAPQLMRLRQLGVTIDGVAIRDSAPAIRAFLTRNGNPYERIGDDQRGAVQLALGSSGVPETFVIDANGVIVEQHIGDIRADEVDRLAALAGVAR